MHGTYIRKSAVCRNIATRLSVSLRFRIRVRHMMMVRLLGGGGKEDGRTSSSPDTLCFHSEVRRWCLPYCFWQYSGAALTDGLVLADHG